MLDCYTRTFIWSRSGNEEAMKTGIIANIAN